MKFRKIIFIIISIIICIFGVLYINTTYFFNPITFKNDSITHLPFTMYKNPMVYSFQYYEKSDLYIENINDEKTISLIFKELKKSNILGPVEDGILAKKIKGSNLKGHLWVNSYAMTGVTVMELRWYGVKSGVCEVSGQYSVNGKKVSTMLIVETTSLLKDKLRTIFGS